MNKKYASMIAGTMALAASVLAGSPVSAHHATNMASTSYALTTVIDPADPTFTQLLGINRSSMIAGYFGSGAAGHPNKGFVLNLPNMFTSENYPGSVQTQVIGINNAGDTDGFYIDSAGVTHGFTDSGGTFATVDVLGTTFDQLLGLNNSGEQAGYYAFGPSNAQTFVPFIHRPDGSFELLPIANAQATGINDQDLVSGFTIDAKGMMHGFLWRSGSTPLTVDFPGATATQLLGLNNQGMAVGSYTDSAMNTHGFVYNWQQKTFTQIDMQGSNNTVINGINDQGQVVGFFVDAAGNTDGLVGRPHTGMGNTGESGMTTNGNNGMTMPMNKFTSTVNLSVTSTLTQVRIPVSFFATVNPNQATGTILLLDGTQQIASGQLRNGSVTFRGVFLAGGTHHITAEYLGDTTFQPSISSQINEKVNLSF